VCSSCTSTCIVIRYYPSRRRAYGPTVSLHGDTKDLCAAAAGGSCCKDKMNGGKGTLRDTHHCASTACLS
jgi:hypothetical protein